MAVGFGIVGVVDPKYQFFRGGSVVDGRQVDMFIGLGFSFLLF